MRVAKYDEEDDNLDNLLTDHLGSTVMVLDDDMDGITNVLRQDHANEVMIPS